MTSPRRTGLQIGLATFSILVLELAVIRWMSQQIRVFAYLNNLLLIAAFLGMGTGLGLARTRTTLITWTLPLLACLVAILAFARPIGLMDLSFPDISIALWGAEGLHRGQTFLASLAAVLVLFVLVSSVFACGGNLVGALFAKLPPLHAYSADLLGSLLGVLAMAAAAALATPPPVWFALGAIPILIVSKRVTDVVALAVIVLLTARSIEGAKFSPYNRLDLLHENTATGPELVLAANRDFHQYLYDLSDRAMSSRGPQRVARAQIRYTYDLPWHLSLRRERGLVVGAGTGNDVAAGLRAGYASVTSVDIDPLIIRTGEALHPERPYADARTHPVVNDARNFFERYSGPGFDVVCFGLLDSHAMFSAMSTLRLDNYVYTADGLRSAWSLVAPGGVMSVTFQVWQGEWIAQRITAAIEAATGQTPIVFGGEARTFVVAKQFDLRSRVRGLPALHASAPSTEGIRLTTDDWPFLYLRPGVVPYGYISVLAAVNVIGFIGVRFAFGAPALQHGRFDVVLFLMGAAFLLIETRGVTDLSLLFGSTWIVNSAVFGGVLFIAWIANGWVVRRDLNRVELWFVPLIAALVLSYFLRPSALLALPFPAGGIAGSLINALPIGFAAVIFSHLLRQSGDAPAALGSNLLGAVVGGCLEYVSLFAGLRSVTLIAIALYLAAFLLLQRSRAAAA